VKLSQRLTVSALIAVGGMVLAGTTALAVTPAAPAPITPESSRVLAARSAANLVAARPAYLHASADEAFQQKDIISSEGMQYVPYERSYKGLPVVGGDFVLVTDGTGALKASSVAQDRAIGALSTTPTVAQADAAATAAKQLTTFANSEGSRLVVYALGEQPRLAWETTVNGTGPEGASRLTVQVDALTGAVLQTREHVTSGTGTAAYSGPNPLTLATSLSSGTYSMKDPVTTSLSCQDAATNTTFSGSDDAWGNGVATNKETGCVDALYAAQTEIKMLSNWLGRNGFNGTGGGWPIRVGLNDQNAYYDGTQIQIGKNTAGAWIASMDVVGHELGHGIDDKTPGGISNGNTQEFVADTFGAMTEWYANQSSAYDPPDFQVGEEINLVGNGPIRYMYNPSLAGDDNCYSSSTPSDEVHAAAGPGNHWFYLLAMGTNPTNGQPTSSTCNSTTITGLGMLTASKIMYNAMLMKTSSSSYLKYRTWTLTAAKNLTPGVCTAFNTVKAAWNAVSVPAQTADPTCTGGTTPSPTPTATGGTGCSGQKLLNPGFESGATSWTQTSGVITTDAGQPAHGGSYKAWLDGYGSAHTDTLSQSVTIPAGCTATLTYYLHIDTAETTTTVAYDKLTVAMGTTTVASYSNINKNTGYLLRTVNVSAYAGSTVTLKFTGVEDSSLQTSFVLDDLALTLS
jgi:zinc metalloprotease ZmpA